MNHQIIVTKKFKVETPSPEQVEKYLIHIGYPFIETDGEEDKKINIYQGSQKEICVPLNPEVSDYTRWMQQCIHDISKCVGKDELDVWSDIMDLEENAK